MIFKMNDTIKNRSINEETIIIFMRLEICAMDSPINNLQ